MARKPKKREDKPAGFWGEVRPMRQIFGFVKWLLKYMFQTKNFINVIAMMVVGTLVYKELKNLPMSDQFLIFCGLVMGYYFRRSPDKD